MPSRSPIVYPLAGKRVWVAGHRGMVGSALMRRLASERCELLTVDRSALDLRSQPDVDRWIRTQRPQAVFIAAAVVGGIQANASRPVDFLYDNVAIATNIIRSSAEHMVEKLMFLGAACLYPRLAPQPMSESSLLEGPPEPTNEWYTVAKLTGVKLCQAYRRQLQRDFVSVVPANLYGPGDHFDPAEGHVVPGLIMRMHTAKTQSAPEVSIWGSGKALREFMHVDDCADALIFLMTTYNDERLINVGTGQEVSIAELANKVRDMAGYSGRLVFDTTKPDGMPRKLLNSARILAMGWRPRIGLDDGLTETYRWFLDHTTIDRDVSARKRR